MYTDAAFKKSGIVEADADKIWKVPEEEKDDIGRTTNWIFLH